MPIPRTAAPLVASCLALALSLPAGAQGSRPANEQVIVPEVERREVRLPHYPSNDFSVGLFAGTYATQNFGSSGVTGLRLGYHVTEDVFVEGTLGRSKVSDEAFRQILPGGVFVNHKESLTYYNLSAGYNLLTGEAFFGRNRALATQGYLVAGVGSTRLAQQKRQTFNLGFGMRLILSDHVAIQADVRDHLYSLDLLGKRQSTQNPEISAGLAAFF
jgi:outer membrane beta-barrel protein